MIGRTRDRAAIERRAAIAHRSDHVVPHRIANDARHGLLKAVRNAPAGCCRSSAVAIVDQTALAKPGGMTDKRLDHRGFSFVLAGRNAALYKANAGRCGATWIMRAPLREERHDLSYVAISKIATLRELSVGARE